MDWRPLRLSFPERKLKCFPVDFGRKVHTHGSVVASREDHNRAAIGGGAAAAAAAARQGDIFRSYWVWCALVC
eukprot:scaffold131660_cov51-Attheya_sp.AAC.5